MINDRGIKRWRLVVLGIIIFICLGTIYSWSIFRQPIEELFRINATLSGLPYMTFLVFYAASMPITGIILQKHKHFHVVLIGGIMVGTGWIISSFSQNIATLVVTLGVVAGTGVGAVYGAVISAVSIRFPDRKGLATGLTLSGFGLSPFVTAPLARYIIHSYGVMETMRLLGIAFIIVITLSALAYKSPQPASIPKQAQTSELRQNISKKTVLHNSAFIALWVCFGLGTFNGLMAVNIAGPVGQETFKLDEVMTAISVSAFAVFNCIGRPIFGWLTDRLQPKRSAQILFIIIFAASFAMVLVQSINVILYLTAFSFLWLALGGWLAVAPAATSILFGNHNHSKNYGILFTAYGVGAIIGVLTSGIIRDISGSYEAVFYPMMFSAVVGLILSFLIRKKP
jgi:MFS family permease